MKSFDHGLTDNDLAILKNILSAYQNKIDRVAIFGSRASGNYKPYSDIDLVLYGEALTQTDINRLATLFADSPLAYPVDVVAYHLTTHPPFKNHIDKNNQTLID